MGFVETVHQHMQKFPLPLQQEVLDFVLFLEQKNQTEQLKSDHRRQMMREALAELVAINPFAEITDPVAWQREQRLDRSLPGREL